MSPPRSPPASPPPPSMRSSARSARDLPFSQWSRALPFREAEPLRFAAIAFGHVDAAEAASAESDEELSNELASLLESDEPRRAAEAADELPPPPPPMCESCSEGEVDASPYGRRGAAPSGPGNGPCATRDARLCATSAVCRGWPCMAAWPSAAAAL